MEQTSKNRRYEYTITVSFPVEDDAEFCEDSNTKVCDGACDGGCDLYFFRKIKEWVEIMHMQNTEFTSSTITREDHSDDECIWETKYDPDIQACSICKRERVLEKEITVQDMLKLDRALFNEEGKE